MGVSHRIEVAVMDPAYDAEGRAVLHDLKDLGLLGATLVRSVRVYTLSGTLTESDAEEVAMSFLSDAVVDMFAVNRPVIPYSANGGITIEISRRPGVMDPVEASVAKGIRELGFETGWVRTSRKYVVTGRVSEEDLHAAALKVMANDVIEEVTIGRDAPPHPPAGTPYAFEKVEIPIDTMGEAELQRLSTRMQLYLSLAELTTIQKHFRKLGRAPTDVELETLAQTWSEHCVHKTFRGRIRYREGGGEEELIDNLLKSTVVRATRELAKPWCLSVFVDNAGVIDFDGTYGAVFKAETHNHPSAIEPYGGAGTGIGGVIRDPLGTGLGAKPVLNTDVFCLGPPDMLQEDVPRGALHPLRVLKGVVGGVRDYGNRMGIPTANGALCFDRRFVGNPLVFCGNVAMIPVGMAEKRHPRTGQIALVVGGRTGRDGIHGATFSSVELDEESETVSSGAVQIGNPIEEKKVHDFLLRARDAGLYTCITDCGAGGLSSALGEMGEETGVEVDLEKVPLKYEGLTYTEIWISEAQERMVIATDERHLAELRALAVEEDVEITEIARFTGDGQLRLRYDGTEVGCLDMDFLHEGIPQIEREAVWAAPKYPEPSLPMQDTYDEELKKLLADWSICSKEWVIRQYDHEVQANSVVKPLVGAGQDGPGDAAVIAPLLGSTRGLAVGCGINPRYSDLDPYHMAASAIDEALRNVVAVGAPLERCALLDNFCWGNTDQPDRLGGLVRAARACYDVATAYGVPFISGKDSLNNEFAAEGGTIAIPGTLLVSALAVMPDVRTAVTMDAKAAGDHVYLVGVTRDELGASRYYAHHGAVGNRVPRVDTALGRKVFSALSAAAAERLVRALHDCSEGGLAVALAEMAFAGGLGMEIDLGRVPTDARLETPRILFSESNSRLVAEVAPESVGAFEAALTKAGAPFACIGKTTPEGVLLLKREGATVVESAIDALREAWQAPLRF